MRVLLAAGLLLGVGLGVLSSAPVPAPAAPLAQATATPTNTPTATPTLPPAHDYGNGWGLQPLPRANLNCVYATGFDNGVFFSCAPGTPVP